MESGNTQTSPSPSVPAPELRLRSGRFCPQTEDFVYSLVVDGELKIDARGRIWRVANRYWRAPEKLFPCKPHRAEKKIRDFLRVCIKKGPKYFTVSAHRLVYRHFNGPHAQGIRIIHKNGDKSDNRPENLWPDERDMCSAKGCNRKARSLGFCQKHYYRMYRHGDVSVVRHRKHGMGRHPLYITWRGMMDRCHSPKDTSFKYYGGKGIVVCEKWHRIENFIEDMGERPRGTSLHRINNKGNYEPGNVIWADAKTQSRHRNNVKLDPQKANDIRQKVKLGVPRGELAAMFGVARSTVDYVLNVGWN